MSTIQSQVKRKIIERFRISGFTSLVASADILRDVMDKLGLIKVAAEDLAYEEEVLEEVLEGRKKEEVKTFQTHIEIKEGTKTEELEIESKIADDMVIISADEWMPNRPRYAIIIRDEVRKTPIFIRFSPPENERNDQKPPKKEHIEFEILRFHFPKGPPIPTS
jgi:hypothetical protein